MLYWSVAVCHFWLFLCAFASVKWKQKQWKVLNAPQSRLAQTGQVLYYSWILDFSIEADIGISGISVVAFLTAPTYRNHNSQPLVYCCILMTGNCEVNGALWGK